MSDENNGGERSAWVGFESDEDPTLELLEELKLVPEFNPIDIQQDTRIAAIELSMSYWFNRVTDPSESQILGTAEKFEEFISRKEN